MWRRRRRWRCCACELVDNAVNLPGLTPGALMTLRPWLDLAEKLGQLLAATIDDPAVSLELGFHGTAPGVTPPLVGSAALGGFLSTAIPDQVTLINARLLAERGHRRQRALLARARRCAAGDRTARDGERR